MDQGTIIFAAAAVGATGLTALVAYGLSRRLPKPTSISKRIKPWAIKACGPVTARQAVDLAREALGRHTPAGKLRGLSSGPGLDSKGRSSRWNVIFETQDQQRTAIVSFGSSAATPNAALVVGIEILPSPPQPGRALSDVFEDSPAALERLFHKGLVYGDARSNATLSVRPDSGGRPVWRLDVQGQTYETPFAGAA